MLSTRGKGKVMQRKYVIACAAFAVLIAGAAISLGARSAAEADRIDAIETTGPGPLDGMVFVGLLGPEGKPKDVPDTFVFQDGTFLSKECELRCDYPARAYSATQSGTGWEFSSTTRCPYKDATIEWRGTIEGDRVTGMATWTMKRWSMCWILKRRRKSPISASV